MAKWRHTSLRMLQRYPDQGSKPSPGSPPQHDPARWRRLDTQEGAVCVLAPEARAHSGHVLTCSSRTQRKYFGRMGKR